LYQITSGTRAKIQLWQFVCDQRFMEVTKGKKKKKKKKKEKKKRKTREPET
jgi:hypothetical protein